MGFDYIDPSALDKSPLFQMAKEVVAGLPGKIMGGLGKLAEIGDAAIGGVGTAFGSVKDVAMGSSVTDRSPEPAMAKAREPEITPPAQTRTQAHEVNMAELGSFSAPSFSTGARSTGGIGLG